jgi:hypothetical protein
MNNTMKRYINFCSTFTVKKYDSYGITISICINKIHCMRVLLGTKTVLNNLNGKGNIKFSDTEMPADWEEQRVIALEHSRGGERFQFLIKIKQCSIW